MLNLLVSQLLFISHFRFDEGQLKYPSVSETGQLLDFHFLPHDAAGVKSTTPGTKGPDKRLH